jgi:hypothetical protein
MAKLFWEPDYSTPDVSTAIEIPMNYEHGKLGYGQEVPGQFRRELLDIGVTSTYEAIKLGLRTATTRRENYKSGQLVLFTNRNTSNRLLCRVICDSYPVKSISNEDWSRFEGWDINYFQLNPNVINKKQFRFEFLKEV